MVIEGKGGRFSVGFDINAFQEPSGMSSSLLVVTFSIKVVVVCMFYTFSGSTEVCINKCWHDR